MFLRLYDCSTVLKICPPTVSLGHFEEQELGVVLQYLRRQSNVSTIGIWGQCMGSVAGTLRCAKEPPGSIRACVFESPFSDFRQVALGLAQQKVLCQSEG